MFLYRQQLLEILLPKHFVVSYILTLSIMMWKETLVSLYRGFLIFHNIGTHMHKKNIEIIIYCSKINVIPSI